MKIQDVGFLGVFIILLFLRKPRFFIAAGVVCWILAIPFFAKWVFFTGERLTWYGAAFMLTFLVISLTSPDKVK